MLLCVTGSVIAQLSLRKSIHTCACIDAIYNESEPQDRKFMPKSVAIVETHNKERTVLPFRGDLTCSFNQVCNLTAVADGPSPKLFNLSSESEFSMPSSSFAQPTARECVAVCDALAKMHGIPSHKRGQPREGCEIQVPHTVLDSLVRTILSQNTTDTTSQRAFSSLKAAFSDWEQVRTAAPGKSSLYCASSMTLHKFLLQPLYTGVSCTRQHMLPLLVGRLMHSRWCV